MEEPVRRTAPAWTEPCNEQAAGLPARCEFGAHRPPASLSAEDRARWAFTAEAVRTSVLGEDLPLFEKAVEVPQDVVDVIAWCRGRTTSDIWRRRLHIIECIEAGRAVARLTATPDLCNGRRGRPSS